MRRLLLQVRALYFSIRRKISSVVITDDFGIRMRLYPFDKTPIKKLLTRENYKEEFATYTKYAKGIVIDAGANIGIHAVFLGRICEKVYAFEPVPRNFNWLKETIAINDQENIVPIQSALGDEEGTVSMNIFPPERAIWDSIHIPDIPLEIPGSRPHGVQQVPITTLDSFASAEGIQEIGFLKLDVEGHELQVLQGARKLLSEKRIAAISFEVAEWLTKDATPIFDLFVSYGYTTTEPYIPSPRDKNYLALANI